MVVVQSVVISATVLIRDNVLLTFFYMRRPIIFFLYKERSYASFALEIWLPVVGLFISQYIMTAFAYREIQDVTYGSIMVHHFFFPAEIWSMRLENSKMYNYSQRGFKIFKCDIRVEVFIISLWDYLQRHSVCDGHFLASLDGNKVNAISLLWKVEAKGSGTPENFK